MSISVLILTLNEETNLPECLKSVSWSNDIVVFDSYSTDRTVEIAKAAGARIVQRQFDNFATHRNVALHEVNYVNEWVFMIDADERTPKDLSDEMHCKTRLAPDTVAMFRMRRKDHLYGKWLHKANSYPTWFGRLVRPSSVRVERIVNEEFVATGEIGYLESHILHFSYNSGFETWLDSQNRHSSMEAKIKVMDSGSEQVKLQDLFSKDPLNRRRAIKQIALRIPCRPILVFVYWYILRFGFLEGKAGFTHCTLRAFYEYFLNLKVDELKRRKKDLPI